MRTMTGRWYTTTRATAAPRAFGCAYPTNSVTYRWLISANFSGLNPPVDSISCMARK